MIEAIVILAIIGIVSLFILRTGKRPEGCTCETYNPILQGPVNHCPVHKHYIS